MKYIRDEFDFEIKEACAVSLGKFDGLHTGHKYLISHLISKKEELGLKAMIFTFVRPPKDIVLNDNQSVLSTLDEKEIIFSKAGIDYLIEYPFDRNIMVTEAEDFLNFLVNKLNVKAIIAGEDFCFGHERKGNADFLRKMAPILGYEVDIVKKKQYKGKDISSTLIRELIVSGDLELANSLLGYPYFIKGMVISGNRIGRTMDIPTINVIPSTNKVLPPFGVYVASVMVEDKEYEGIANIGVKPTVGENNPIGVETNLFDFKGDLYGKNVEIRLHKMIRPERKFVSLSELKSQINEDTILARKYYGDITKS